VKRTSIVSLALVLGALLACTGPSVPVPPPGAESMSFALDGVAQTATYAANLGPQWGNCWVVVRVERTGDGVVERSAVDARVGLSEPFDAVNGDLAGIRFECDDDGKAAGLCLVIHDGPSNQNFECF